jgi:aerobic carbon-monoxide dehydrogenase large subunit
MSATDTRIGGSAQRKEDQRFLTGHGRYTDDIDLPRQTYAYFLRSPHAHARIQSIDTALARKAPGVVAVFTGEDLSADGVGALPCGWQITDVSGEPMKEPPHPLLAQGKVRYVGDHVAVVIAETYHQARDAAEQIEVDYEMLDAVVSPVDALASGRPLVHDDVPENRCYTWELGDGSAVDEAFGNAAHVTKLDLVNNRLIPNAIEPRAAVAQYSTGDDRYTLYTTSQNPHLTRLLLCAFILNLPEHKVRVVSPDVGGGFGSKIYPYAEEATLTWASRKVGRPVKWTAERVESFLSDAHGRGHAEIRGSFFLERSPVRAQDELARLQHLCETSLQLRKERGVLRAGVKQWDLSHGEPV